MTDLITPPVAPPPAPPPPPAAPLPPPRKGCSPGCRTALVGCGGMILGAMLTIAIEVLLVLQGVSAISDFFERNSVTRPTVRDTTEREEPEDPADLGIVGTRRDAMLQKCGTPAEQSDPDIAAVCREQRAIDEIDERNRRRAERERSSD
jgi:hypothetical protein